MIETQVKTATVKPNSKLANALKAVAQASAEMKRAEDAKTEALKLVRELSLFAERFALPDGTELATDTEQPGRRNCDLDKLAAEYGPAYSACVAQGPAFKVLRLKSGMVFLK